ncbi:hypothetical protein IAU60_002266 [Kwoniella sp. DSM 27419]
MTIHPLIDQARRLLASLALPICHCLRPAAPPSPPLTLQHGELDNLLPVPDHGGWGDVDAEDDELFARLPSAKLNKMRGDSRTAAVYAYPPRHGASGSAPSSVPVSQQSTLVAEDGFKISHPPGQLGTTTPFEPTLTLEDLQREEAEQAERERLEILADGWRLTPPGMRATSVEEDDFGQFEEAVTGQHQSMVTVPFALDGGGHDDR